jgi:hypothetical protein
MSDPILTQEQAEAVEAVKRFVSEVTSWDQINGLISQLQEMGRNRLGPDYSDPAFDI